MALGFFNKVCYSTLQQAIDAHFTQAPSPYVWASTTSDIYHDLTYSTVAPVGWRWNGYTVSSTGTITLNHSTLVPVPNFPSCTLDVTPAEQFADGITLGWGVVAACIAAFALLFLKDAFK